jgi:hypothetical protein
VILKAGEFQFDGTSQELSAVMKHTTNLTKLILSSNGDHPIGGESNTELSGQDNWIQDATPPVGKMGFQMKEEA